MAPVNLSGLRAGAAAADMRTSSGRYQLGGELAHGGMGAILKGRDTDLGREIAVKVLLEKHKDKPEYVRRFVEEAQIGGQLQHPGLVPVYELGQFADQRPYFTMKLVKGQTLAALLAARLEVAEGRPRFLGIFQQVCQTMAYAHARGVIHRDLKPANIMVGSFGEVQVMDWGLAKVLTDEGLAGDQACRPRQGAEEAASAIRTVRTEGPGADSQAGSVLGTPAYMPPEQARGEVERLDQRADVFGLGAILCEILTGQPPYVTEASWQLPLQAAQGDLQGAWTRLSACGADPELIELAKRCLEPEPKDRPTDAGVLAAQLTAYLESVETRLRQAELASVAATAKAQEEHKRWKLTLALAASVLVTVLLAGGGWLWVEQARQQREAVTVREVTAALQEATHLRGQAERARDLAPWAAAVKAAQNAKTLLENGEGGDDLAGRVHTLLAEVTAGEQAARRAAAEKAADREMVPKLEELRWQALLGGIDLVGTVPRFDADRAFAAAFREYGIDVGKGSPAEVGARLGLRAIKVELAVALDVWAQTLRGSSRPGSAARQRRLAAIARHADPDPWRKRLRTARARKDRRTLLDLARTADLDRLPPASLEGLFHALIEVKERDRAAAFLRRARHSHPEDAALNFLLGGYVLITSRTEEAVRFLTAAGALRPRSVILHLALGVVLARKGETREAVAVFRQGVHRQPDNYLSHLILGLGLFKYAKDFDGAIASFQTALRLNNDRSSKNRVGAYKGLAMAWRAKGDLVRSVAAMRKAVRLDPDDPDLHNVLGILLLQTNAAPQALQVLRAAARRWPAHFQLHNTLGVVHMGMGALTEAEKALRKAIQLRPENPRARANLGAVLVKKGDPKALQEALTLLRATVRRHPHHANACGTLGLALVMQGDRAALREALTLLRPAVRRHPKDTRLLNVLGMVWLKRGDARQAENVLRQAWKLRPEGEDICANLGAALLDKGGKAALREAVTILRPAVRRHPKSLPVLYNLGKALFRLGGSENLNEATGVLRRAVTLAPKDGNLLATLGNLLLQKDHSPAELNEAIGYLRRVVRIEPDHFLANLGLFRAFVERDDEADVPEQLAALRRLRSSTDKANRSLLRPWSRAVVPYLLKEGARLFVRERRKEAIACTREAVAWQADLKTEQRRQVQSLLDQGHLEEALAALRKAKVAVAVIRVCEKQLALDRKLSAIRRGTARPADGAERVALGLLCARWKRQYRAAAGFFADAFAVDAKLAEDPKTSNRYNAACYAALAAAGKGEDAAKLDARERARLRKQAVTWLRADLALWAQQAESGQPQALRLVEKKMKHWLKDADLAGLRDAVPMAKLPEEEQDTCRKLWAGVAALLKKAREAK
jgi:serine/threonine-protein kinase